MPGFWVDPGDVGEDRLLLRGDEAHHLTRVRRHGIGDEIEAVDGRGCCYRVRIEAVAEGMVEAGEVVDAPSTTGSDASLESLGAGV